MKRLPKPVDVLFSHPRRGRAAQGPFRPLASRHLQEDVVALLSEHDPIGIIECKRQEYDPEAASIVPRLRECHTEEEACQVIHQEFVREFKANLAGPAERYAQMAHEIWRLWQGRQERFTRTEAEPR